MRFLEARARLFEKRQLLGGGRATEAFVAMREAAEAADHLAMALGVIQIAVERRALVDGDLLAQCGERSTASSCWERSSACSSTR